MPSLALAAATMMIESALLVSAAPSKLEIPPRLHRRFNTQNESAFWEGDTPPTVDNNTFGLYAWSRGLDGVDQSGNFQWFHVLLVSMIALCVGVFMLRVARTGQAYLRHIVSVGSIPDQVFWRQNRSIWWPWMKKNLEYAPLWRVRHNTEIRLSSAVSIGTLPSRFHMLLLISFAACNTAYMLCLPWHEAEKHAVVAALRGRAGMLAMYNMLVGVLFTLRNNPLIPLLQVSYDTFNLLHRWTMRMFAILVIVHMACWYDNTWAAGRYEAIKWTLATVPSYQWGLVATVFIVVMTALAWSPIRHAWYETFIWTHRLFAFMAFIGTYLHLEMHHLPQLPWMQFICALWILEYVCRGYSIFYYNIGMDRMTRVTVEALPSEAIRVTFNLVRPWKPRPGCHAHFYLPSVGWFGSHPFSVAWADLAPVKPSDTEKNILNIYEDPKTKAHTACMVIRARSLGSFTRSLYDKAAAQKTNVFSAYGLIEGLGTYGGHHSLRSYGTVVLFAAGVGITHQTMYVRDLVSGFHAGTIATRKITLIWTIPNNETLAWISPWMDEVLKMPGRKECLQIKLFVTKARKHSEQDSRSGTVSMYAGRPQAQVILDEAVKGQVGAMAVTACGAGRFSDDVRKAVRNVVQGTVVDFIEEAFTY